MPLEFEISLPEEVAPDAPLIVLLHGRGSDRFDLLGLRRGLPARAIIVTPQAPFPGTQWGYGGGWAWYRFLGDDRPDPESFEESQRVLTLFLQELPARLPVSPGATFLGGFSQGGTMSIGHALGESRVVSNILNFSGFIPDHPSVRITSEQIAGAHFFWGHGTQDPAISFTLAEEGWSALRAIGARLEARSYPIGHWIDPEELAAAVAWIEGRIQAEQGGS